MYLLKFSKMMSYAKNGKPKLEDEATPRLLPKFSVDHQDEEAAARGKNAYERVSKEEAG